MDKKETELVTACSQLTVSDVTASVSALKPSKPYYGIMKCLSIYIARNIFFARTAKQFLLFSDEILLHLLIENFHVSPPFSKRIFKLNS